MYNFPKAQKYLEEAVKEFPKCFELRKEYANLMVRLSEYK